MGAGVSPQGHAALSSARRSWHHIRPTKVADTTCVYEKVVGSASVLSTVSLVMGASVFPPGAYSTLNRAKVAGSISVYTKIAGSSFFCTKVAGSTVCTKAGGTTLDSPPRGLQHMQLHQGAAHAGRRSGIAGSAT